MQRRIASYSRTPGTSTELCQHLRRRLESCGAIVVGVFVDQDAWGRRGRTSGWRLLLASLDGVDQIAMASAGDIPAKTVGDLLKLLAILRDHDVALTLLAEGIDTSRGSALMVLDIIQAFRSAKLSKAIRHGQAKARASGRRIGRPEVPASIRRRIEAALVSGGGVRPTARAFGVAPATVLNIRQSMVQRMAEAA